ncbi:hypothetical protein RHGRI_023784 [Rhododendron griersonianum]|uniref:USP8 dimerisation domain-containing protein n=1 Tax=Rhododendron griersonianum TaxID=479676 RepID=A0AAV6JA94_9ERIC|nr:hypothetical protein RHGRI_023784 [Rhododendron griersonianum]
MMTKSSSGGFTIAGSAQKLDVNNRIALRYYYRIADNILKQADIFREEDNIIDLYVMLLRFSRYLVLCQLTDLFFFSLVSDTIPCHQEYRASPQSNKLTLKKKLLSAVSEMEMLKPKVQKKIAELNRRHMDQANGWGHVPQNSRFDSSLEWPPIKKQSLTSFVITKTQRPAAQGYSYQGSRTQPSVHAKPVEEQFRRLSLTIPCPKEETRSRHSILGPSGLYGQWQPPSNDKRVQYPSNIDLTPVEIPRLDLL